MDQLPSKLSHLEVLKLVSLSPLIAFKDPREFWIDYRQLTPIEELNIYCSTADKLHEQGLHYLGDLVTKPETQLKGIASLSLEESEDLVASLLARGIHLPEDDAHLEDRPDRRQSYAHEIELVKSEALSGSHLAALCLAKLAEANLVNGSAEGYYRLAIQLGSIQAANDLGVILHRKKLHTSENQKEVLSLYEKAAGNNLPQGMYNLAVAILCFYQRSDENVQSHLERASSLGVSEATRLLEAGAYPGLLP
ncbi:MAG: hypothetical protein HGA71_19785 [Azonexaceae bacterium]|nr:hypothetical protein [Azonexaceae bacterium]